MTNYNTKASVGNNVVIDDYVVLSDNCIIGDNCKIHYFSFIDSGVKIGANTKIQNNVMIPEGVDISDGVFIGPNAIFTNDKNPRSVTVEGILKTSKDWTLTKTKLEKGCSIGAGAVVVCGVTIGEWAMVGAGSVVTKDIPNHALVVGNPAKQVGWVDKSGYKMKVKLEDENSLELYSEYENMIYNLKK